MPFPKFSDKYLKFRSPKVFWRNWHGLLGVLIALPLIFLTVTGVLLNHSDAFQLRQKQVHSPWVLEKYGFEQGEISTAASLVGGGYVAQSEDAIIYRGEVVATTLGELVGGAKVQNGYCLVTTKEVHYFGSDGGLIETLGSTVLPSGEILRAGVDQGKLLVLELEGEEGQKTLRFDQDMVAPVEEHVTDVKWSETKALSATEQQQVYQALSGEGIPLDRVILDLHSGNLFGAAGKWTLTFFSLVILVVSVSGVFLFVKNRTRRRKDCLKECASVCQDFE